MGSTRTVSCQTTGHQETKVRLGVYRGRRYYLTTRVTPSVNTVEEFSVVVYYRNLRTGSSVQIARIDTSHGFVHFNRLYDVSVYRYQVQSPGTLSTISE